MTVLTTEKRADQRAWPRPPGDFRVVEIGYKVPRLLERMRGAYKGDEAGDEATDDAGVSGRVGSESGLMSKLRNFRGQRGIFCSVRMPDLTDFWVKPAVEWAKHQEPWDVVVSSAGPYTAHLAAMALKRAGKTDLWASDYRDLWVGNHIHRGVFPFTLRERSLQRRCLNETDLIVTVSDPLARVLGNQSNAPATVIYNGFDPSDRDDLDERPIFPDDDLVRLVFTGSVYATGQDPRPLLKSMAKIRRDDPAIGRRLRLVVAGGSIEYWINAAEKCGASDMLEAVGMIERQDAMRMQRDADALVLVDFEANVEGALTSKAFEYLSVDTPILVVGGEGDTPIKKLVESTGRGGKAGRDEAGITRFLLGLAGEEAPTLPARNDEIIGSYTRERQSLRLLTELKKLMAAR